MGRFLSRILQPFALAAACLLLAFGCNSGGGGSSANSGGARNLSYTPAAPVFILGGAIAPLTPSVQGARPIAFAIAPALPDGLSLDPATGTLQGTPSAALPATSFTVTASNAQGSSRFTLQITVSDQAPAISYASPATMFVGQAAYLEPTSSGGPAASWAITPALPAGLTFHTDTGIIDGRPGATLAATRFTVTATNAVGPGTAQVVLAITGAPVYSSPRAQYVVGSAIAPNVPNVASASSWTSDRPLPAGLVLDAATGRITGTPTAPSPAEDYTISARLGGQTIALPLNLTVLARAAFSLSYGSSSIRFTRNVAIASLTPTPSVAGSYSYSVDRLPAGLGINAGTGVISGRPTTVTAPLVCTVTALAAGRAAQAQLTLAVADAAGALSYPVSAETFTVNRPIADLAPTLAGAGPATRYSVSPALPAGLSLDPLTGVLSGTPTALTAQDDYTINAVSPPASAVLSLTVGDVPPTITYPPLILTTGHASPGTPPATSGGAVTGWSLAGGALPPGMDLDGSTGALTGIPTASQAATLVTIRADYFGGTVDAQASVQVVDLPAITSFPRPLTLATGDSFDFTARFTGGTGRLTDSSLFGFDQPVLDNVPVPLSPAASTTYTFIVTNAAGAEVSQDLAVTVRPRVAIISFTATPASVPFGQPTRLDWTLSGVPDQELELSDNLGLLRIDVALGQTGLTFTPVRRQTFTLASEDSLGNATRTVTVAARGLDHLAGDFGGAGHTDGAINGGPRPQARFAIGGPGGLAMDGQGDLYVADTENNTIRQIVNGRVTTLAGKAGEDPGDTDGDLDTARFDHPLGIAVNRAGTAIYVAEYGNNLIRRIDTILNQVTTLAGPALALPFSRPSGMALDGAEQFLYVADQSNGLVRQVDVTTGNVVSLPVPPGLISTPSDVAVAQVNGAEHIFVADSLEQAIIDIPAANPAGAQRLAGQGTLTTFAAPAGLAVVGTDLMVADRGNDQIIRIGPLGGALAASLLAGPDPAAVPPPPRPWNGYGDGAGDVARFDTPSGMVATLDGAGLLVGDRGNGCIRRVNLADRNVTTFAGSRALPPALVNGTGQAARFSFPTGIAVDGQGNAFVADTGNSVIRMITPKGEVSTWAGDGTAGYLDGAGASARFEAPLAVAAGAGGLYVADTHNHVIRRIDATGNVSTLAGRQDATGHDDGDARTVATFDEPRAVAVDPAGAVFVGDGPFLRRIANGQVTTVAGQGGEFREISSLAVDANGAIYVADPENRVIHRVVPDPGNPGTYRVTTTLAGVALAGVVGDPGNLDGPQGANRLSSPTSVALSGDGLTLYFTELDIPGVRKVDLGSATLDVSRVLGSTLPLPIDDAILNAPVDPGTLDAGPDLAQMCSAYGLAVTPAGDLLATILRFPGGGGEDARGMGVVQITAP